MIQKPSRFRCLVVGLLFVSLSACATPTRQRASVPQDPWEGFNRSVFSFNEGFDRALIKPLAKGYDAIVPTQINTIVTNFFANIDDLMIAVNDLLQGKFKASASDLGRVVLNSTLGIGGLIDVATGMTLEKHEEDFGQTFARWGLGQGPYVVLPVFGRSTVLDTFGFAADVPTNPVSWVKLDVVRFSATGLHVVDARADLLSAEKVVDEGAIDKYSYMRSAYLQRRQYLIYDGNPPREKEEE